MEEVTAEISELIGRREVLRDSLAEVNSRRGPFAETVEKATSILAKATANLALADAEIAEARVPIVAEIEDVRSALRVAGARQQALEVAAMAEPGEPGIVVGAPGIESEEKVGAIGGDAPA
jgi:hypothetical protein